MLKKPKLRPRGILSILVILLLLTTGAASILFTVLLIYYKTTDAISAADNRLRMAAEMSREMVGPGFHDRIVDASSVSAKQFARIVDRNDDLCRRLDLQYLWSVLQVGDDLVFTTATRSDVFDPASAHAGFFEVHKDPAAFATAMGPSAVPAYSSFRNEWGEGRMILIPRDDAAGRRYIFGASIQLKEYDSMIRNALLAALAIGLGVLLAALLPALLLARRLTGPISRLTDAADQIKGSSLPLTLVYHTVHGCFSVYYPEVFSMARRESLPELARSPIVKCDYPAFETVPW
jgi:hypothetical protein